MNAQLVQQCLKKYREREVKEKFVAVISIHVIFNGEVIILVIVQ